MSAMKQVLQAIVSGSLQSVRTSLGGKPSKRKKKVVRWRPQRAD